MGNQGELLGEKKMIPGGIVEMQEKTGGPERFVSKPKYEIKHTSLWKKQEENNWN